MAQDWAKSIPIVLCDIVEYFEDHCHGQPYYLAQDRQAQAAKNVVLCFANYIS